MGRKTAPISRHEHVLWSPCHSLYSLFDSTTKKLYVMADLLMRSAPISVSLALVGACLASGRVTPEKVRKSGSPSSASRRVMRRSYVDQSVKVTSAFNVYV